LRPHCFPIYPAAGQNTWPVHDRVEKTTEREIKMKQQGTTATVRFSNTLFAGVTAMLMMVFSGTVNAQTDAEYYYDNAVHYMNKGYAELGKVEKNLDKNKTSSATKHFNKALKDFDNALVNYSKAALPAADKPAIKALQKGLKALEKTTKNLEKSDYASAQNNYDMAQGYFAQASLLLD
jgi:ABC-type antimicrobial peptide transport system permease subunit